jgi:hypothetical protein
MDLKKIFLLAIILGWLVITSTALVFSNSYDHNWWTVDGGGGTSQGGDYVLSGTVGQPEGDHLMSGGNFNLVGGFWANEAAVVLTHKTIYLPLVSR